MSLPLRKLYISIIDIYGENKYPISFPNFYDVFMKHMKFTRNNIIDSVVLLLFGIDEIDKFGTGEELIDVDRIKNYEKKDDEKTRISPIFDFHTKYGKIRIGYDYAGLLKENDEIPIESDKVDFKCPNIDIDIDPEKYILKFCSNNKYFVLDLKNNDFKSFFELETQEFKRLSENANLKLMDKVLPAPEGFEVKKSFWCDQYYFSELTIENNYMIYHIGTTNNDLITFRDEKYYVERIYDVSNIDVGMN